MHSEDEWQNPFDGGEDVYGEFDNEAIDLFFDRAQIRFGKKRKPKIQLPDAVAVPRLIDEMNLWWCNN